MKEYAEKGIKCYDDDNGADKIEVKSLSLWPAADYYNIWVVHKISGSANAYADYPTGSKYNGTVIEGKEMGYSETTLAHELGHALGLNHTFSEKGNAETDCATEGDRICDTPPHKKLECGYNPGSSAGNLDNSYKNFMSYCSPVRDRFTQGQKDRMIATLHAQPRISLLSSTACSDGVTGTNEIIHQAYEIKVAPNPFANSTTIIFSIPKAEKVSIRIFDMIGRLITNVEADYQAGEHSIEWTGNGVNGNSLDNGLYHVTIQAGDYSQSVKTMLVR